MRGRELWWALRGMLCVYKPADLSASALIRRVSKAIVEDANAWTGEAKRRQWPKRLKPVVDEHPTSGALVVVGQEAVTDYSEHPLVVGSSFRVEDLNIRQIGSPMEATTSGVCLLGVNLDEDDPEAAYGDEILNTEFEIDGVLGRETLRHEIRQRVVFSCVYGHVSKFRMERLLAMLATQYRRVAWELTGLHLDSPEAFEVARKGDKELWRRAEGPLFTAFKLVAWRPPHFRLLVSARAQPDAVVRCLPYELGIGVGTTASCRRLHRLSVANFTTRHALLPKQLTLNNILRNLRLTKHIREGKSEEEFTSEVVEPLTGDFKHLPEYDALQPLWGRAYEKP